MTVTAIYIHGIGNKPKPEQLKHEWDQALFGKDMGQKSKMAYWASLRYQHPLPHSQLEGIEPGQLESLDNPVPGQEGMSQAEVDPIELQKEILTEVHLEMGGTEGVAQPAELDSWLQRMAYQADALVEGEEAAKLGPGAELLPLPRSVRVAIFRALVKATMKDVYAYFFDGFGEPIRKVLRTAIADTDGELIVIGHSLGSVIAYDVLRETEFAQRRIPLFVTVGSPLAVQEIQDVITRPLLVPAGVDAWRNVTDARDLVALDSTVRPEYDPAERCTDFLVVNDSSNHHGIEEYLRTQAIRGAVLPFFA